MNLKKMIGVTCLAALSGMSLASASDSYVHFENGQRTQDGMDCDAPDVCVPFDWTTVLITGEYDCEYINGQLEKRYESSCEPDTYLVCFDKQNNILDSDDNSSNKGNGWASGLWGSDCIVDNNDGSFSLRLGVTGRPDGLDGVFNGLFQNGPHGQLGGFSVHVSFESNDAPLIESGAGYVDEFVTGAEAFYINFDVPAGTTAVHVNIDNTIGSVETRCDVDFMKLTNLVPLCDYCIEQIGGLNCECTPTDARLGWFDKSCTQILSEGSGGAVDQYAKLCAVADANGEINIAVSGEYDDNFNGIHDEHEVVFDDRAPIECPEPKWGHGEAGCYTLKVYVIGVHDNDGGMPTDEGDSGALMQLSLDKGDLNMDGQTNSADLGILLGNFGWAGN
jgi:hypothetical protein